MLNQYFHHRRRPVVSLQQNLLSVRHHQHGPEAGIPLDLYNYGADHDRNLNAARDLHKLALLAVGEDVTLPDGKLWLATFQSPAKPPRTTVEPSR